MITWNMCQPSSPFHDPPTAGSESSLLRKFSLWRLSNAPWEQNDLLSPEVTTETAGIFTRHSRLEDIKVVTWWSGVCLVVSQQIGSGIFSTPALVNNAAGSVGMSLIVWIIAGCIAWSGASSYAELGSAIPVNGGSFAYLHYVFGPLPAFLFSWTTIMSTKPVSAAMLAIIFGEYINRVLFWSLKPNESTPFWADKLVALVCVWIVIAQNAIGSEWGTKVNNLFAITKVTTLMAVAIIGIVVLAWGHGSDNFSHDWFQGTSTNLGNYALALYAGLHAYSGTFQGWDNMSYVVGEMKNPSRDLSRVIRYAITIVIASYLAANIGYYAVLPMDVIVSSETIALDFGFSLLGSAGGVIFALCVAASCFGSLNSVTFTSSRLIYAAGQKKYLPSTFGELHPKLLTPIKALMLQGVLSSIMVLIGNFKWLILYNGLMAWSWYLLTTVGVVVLRTREPTLERPYRVFLTTPIIFSCSATFLLLRGVILAPLQGILVVAFMITGVPLYYIFVMGWKLCPALRLLGINLPLGRDSLSDTMVRQGGYTFVGEGDATSSDDMESTRE